MLQAWNSKCIYFQGYHMGRCGNISIFKQAAQWAASSNENILLAPSNSGWLRQKRSLFFPCRRQPIVRACASNTCDARVLTDTAHASWAAYWIARLYNSLVNQKILLPCFIARLPPSVFFDLILKSLPHQIQILWAKLQWIPITRNPQKK